MSLCQWSPKCPERAGPSGYCASHRAARARADQFTANGYTRPTRLHKYLTTWTSRHRRLITLARLAGVPERVLCDFHGRRVTWLRPGVTDAVLAVPLPPSDIGCVRRLQALAVRGHTVRHTAHQIGTATTYDALVQALGVQQFSDTLAYTVAAYYPTAILRLGPSALMTQRALANGYRHPLAWLGLDIDDPAVEPHPVPFGPPPLTLANAWPRAMALQGLSAAWLRTQGLQVREAA
jgi:hypothetical protein